MGSTEIELDAQEVRPALRLLSKLEKLRPGLGFPILWLTFTRLGAYLGGGRGAFVVGRKGIGKAAMIYGARARSVLGAEVEAPGELHPRWLANYLKGINEAGGDASRLTLTLEDMAPVSDDRPKLKRILNAGAWGVSDKKFADKGWYGRSSGGAADRFTAFHVTCGMTPKVFHKISKLGPWGDMWSDRYTVFAPVRRAVDTRRITPGLRTLAHERVAALVDAELPLEIRQPEIIADAGLMREASKLMYEIQHTRDRAEVYLAQDLKGVAALCDSDVANDSHLLLLMQAAPFVQLGAMPWEVIEVVQHGGEGEEPPGHTISMSRVAELTRRRVGRLGPALAEARRYGFLEYYSPTGKTGQANIWLGVKLSEQLHNIDRLARWGARFGG